VSIQNTDLNPCQRMSDQEQNSDVQARRICSVYDADAIFIYWYRMMLEYKGYELMRYDLRDHTSSDIACLAEERASGSIRHCLLVEHLESLVLRQLVDLCGTVLVHQRTRSGGRQSGLVLGGLEKGHVV